jgi:predicted RNase H-like HicB family nuclease
MNVKVIIEEHSDGFVAYPVGLKGVVVAQGDTYDEALLNAESAIKFHLETFGPDALVAEDTAIQVFVADTAIAV